ncbi:hypothetical protein [Ruegeria sp. HKCCD8929]|uniref:hypothetical protein n=1 Tax=Ruegeria sp. HKCCD8929 TaxID=2683006 RepID=UPI001487FC43|nr:hypothetical protein [Ruegeria sp. HKCCD8929]
MSHAFSIALKLRLLANILQPTCWCRVVDPRTTFGHDIFKVTPRNRNKQMEKVMRDRFPGEVGAFEQDYAKTFL